MLASPSTEFSMVIILQFLSTFSGQKSHSNFNAESLDMSFDHKYCDFFE